MGLAGENENDNKNEVPETKRERVREICSLLPHTNKRKIMTKYLILLSCIILSALALFCFESANVAAGIASFVFILGIIAYEIKCDE